MCPVSSIFITLPLNRILGKALFPHILTKNQDVKVNFGQSEASFHPLPGYQFIGHMDPRSLVRGTKAPKSKQDCEVIMMCGPPGTGKTSWAYKHFEQNPDKLAQKSFLSGAMIRKTSASV